MSDELARKIRAGEALTEEEAMRACLSAGAGPALTPGDAMAVSMVRRGGWLLLAWEKMDDGLCRPVYTCPRCFKQRYTLVSEGAIKKLPKECPKCGVELSPPS